MSESRPSKTIRLTGEAQRAYVQRIVSNIQIGGERLWEVVIQTVEEKRTLDQNAKLWPMCTDVARQVEWYGRYLDKDSWKQMFVAALKGQDTVPGIDGGFVVLGGSSRNLRKREFCDLIEIIYAFGAEHDVVWSEKAAETFDEYREAA